MKASKTILRLMTAVLVSTAFGCVTYEEGSLLHMERKQQQQLYMACMRVQLDRNMHYVTDMGSLSVGCRKWAQKTIKPSIGLARG